MNKNKTAIITAAILVLVLAVFAACGKSDKLPEPSTIIGVDGSVYDELTEVVSEVVTEVVSELKTEIVTDKAGKTEVKSEVVTEIKSEIVTSINTVTVLHTTVADKDNDKDNDKTDLTLPDITTAETTEGTTNEEDITYPAGTRQQVELGADGMPVDSLRDKAFKNIREKNQAHIECVIVAEDAGLVETGTPVDLWIKPGKMALQATGGGIKMKYIVADGKVSILLPVAKTYYTRDAEGDTGFDNLDELLSSDLEYVQTTKVTVRATSYFCEEYKSTDGSTFKFYFNIYSGELKRFEIIDSTGEGSIIKVTSLSSDVPDSAFQIPSGYTQLSDEALTGLFDVMS